MFVCPATDTSRAVALLERRVPPATSAAEERIPPGISGPPVLDFRQILAIYGELTGRTVEIGIDTNFMLPFLMPKVQTPLTRTEAIYAFDLLLAWNGFEVLSQADGKARLIRIETNGSQAPPIRQR